MPEDLTASVAGIGALAEPVRRRLYDFVAGRDGPVSREQAAEGAGLPVHTVKFHLDRLVDDGLLEVEFRRLTGRTGPGAGRPAKLYRRSAREFAVSLPERRYDLVGAILAAGCERAVESGVDVATAVRDAAGERGRAAGATAPASGTAAGSGPARVAEVLAGQGFEPRVRQGRADREDREDIVELANCPFDALAREHTALVCGLNQAYVDGVIAGAGCPGLEACLEPEPGLCCVKVRPAAR